MEPPEAHREYFLRRAEQERTAAARAVDARAAQSHWDLAARFDALANDGIPELWVNPPAQSPGTLPAELRIIP